MGSMIKDYVDSVMLFFGMIWLFGGTAVMVVWSVRQIYDLLCDIEERG